MGLEDAIVLARQCIILGLWGEVKPRVFNGEWIVWCVRRGGNMLTERHDGVWFETRTQQVDMFRSLVEVEAFVAEAYEAEQAARD